MGGVFLCAVNAYALGVMIVPLEQEFGWSRADISGGPLILALIALVAGPFVGFAIDRFGSRPIGLLGIVSYCVALGLMGMTSSLVGWWGHWALIGMANMLVGPMVWTSVISHRFEKNRGKALAIALCGTGVAGLVVPMLTHVLIERDGWRAAYRDLALICAAVVLPVALALFRDVRGPSGEKPVRKPRTPEEKAELRAHLASPSFLKLTVATITFSIAGCALTNNGVPILLAEGFDRGTAAELAGLIGAGAIVGRLTCGVLLDRFDPRVVAAGSVLAPVVTASLLLATQGSETVAAAAYVVIGLAAGAEVDACAYLAARLFGLRWFGALFGAVCGLQLFAAGMTPLLSNAVYDATKSYDIALWAVIPLSIVSAGLLLLLRRTSPGEAEAPVAVATAQLAPAASSGA
jgi:MFS family permease